MGGLQARPGPNFDKRTRAGPRTVGLLKPVLLKSDKLTIVADKIKPFNLYISNRYNAM